MKAKEYTQNPKITYIAHDMLQENHNTAIQTDK